ncbi:MAG: hypothetical protein M0P73_01995 [Syntrophobacterales bacterium]|jgi:hypothetical protein|nr:hypothetical protein [Syntrophobacterales bacterium]
MSGKVHYKMALVATLLVASCLLSASPLLAVASMNTIIDDFNDNSINTSLWQAISSGTGFTVKETNQRLQIWIAGTTSGDAGYQSRWALRGDFDMQVDFTLLNWPSGNGVEVGLGLNKPLLTDLIAGVALFGDHTATDGTHYNQIYYGETSVAFGSTVETDIAPGGGGSFRITRTGNTIDCYYMGPTDWINVAHSEDPSLALDAAFLLACGLNSGTIPGGLPVQIAFDNFQLQYDQLVFIPLPSALLLLGSGLLGLGLSGLRRKMKKG